MAATSSLIQPVAKAPPVTTAASLGDEWYLKAYKVPGAEQGKYTSGVVGRFLPISGSWKRVVIACSFGVCLGLGFASWRMPQTLPSAGHSGSVATETPANSEVATSIPPVEPAASEAKGGASSAVVHRTASVTEDDATRLKIRNRRLEALVKVLRERQVEKRTPPDPTTHLGQ